MSDPTKTHLDFYIEDLQAQIAAIMADLKPMHDLRDSLTAQIQPLEKARAEICEAISLKEEPARKLGNELAAAIRAKPTTRSLSNG